MKAGYHVIEEKVASEEGLDGDKDISFIKFLNLVLNKDFEKFTDYTVTGLETLVVSVEDQEGFLNYVNKLLTERSPYMTSTGNVFMFKVDVSKSNIEIWMDKPFLKNKTGEKTPLNKIFGNMSVYKDNPDWFWQQLNVES